MGRIGSWVDKREQALIAWEHAKPSRVGKACYRAYSLFFLPFAILVFLGLLTSGRELIWNIDGLSQYYAFFVYEGEWLRGIFAGLFSGEGLNIPLWAWNSGYGADVLTAFDFFFDPLNLFSAVAPGAASEWVFQLLVLVRLYLAGLAFVFYCRTRGENRRGTVLGALLYAFCGAGLTVVQWTSGLHAFILFPVILAGAERLLAGGKPWVFIASLTLLAIVSYYFTYMVCILLVGYLALRVVMVERPHLTAGTFLKWVAVFAGLVVLCLALAAFSIAPALTALFGMDRYTDQSTVVSLLYAPSYYLNLITGFLSTSEIGSDSFQGFGGLALFACFALFLRKGENRGLKIVLAVLTVFLLLPAVGSFFNGFNYATNRWVWAYALCVAFVLTRMTPSLLALDARGKKVMVVGAAVYALVLLVPTVRTEANVAGFAALLATLAVLVAAMGDEQRRGLLTGALALTLAVNGFYFLSAGEGGRGVSQAPLGSAYAKLTSASVDSLALETGDASWWRYDAGQVSIHASSPMSRVRNNSLVLGVSGIDFYSSVYNSGVDRFHTELAVAGDNVNFNYLNLQGRSDLMALLGVKYYALRNDGSDAAPYLFESGKTVVERPVAGVAYSMVQSGASLPVGFVFGNALSREDYEGLTPAQRQQALLQAVVLEQPAAGVKTVKADDLSFEDREAAFSVAAADGVVVEEGGFVATRAGATVTLETKGLPRADTYLYATGLTYRGMKPSELVSQEGQAAMTWYKRAALWAEDLSYAAPVEYEIAVGSDVSPTKGYIVNNTPDYHMYGGKDTWLVNLGFASEPAREVTLTFSQPGAYSYESLQVVAQTNEKLAGWMADLAKTPLENAVLGCNSLTGSVSLDEPGTLLMTVAYSPGWTAYVDGEPVDILRADTAFMGLDLPAGSHDIELRYFTPGLALGGAVTAGAVIVLVALAIVLRWRAKREKEQK